MIASPDYVAIAYLLFAFGVPLVFMAYAAVHSIPLVWWWVKWSGWIKEHEVNIYANVSAGGFRYTAISNRYLAAGSGETYEKAVESLYRSIQRLHREAK